MRRALLLLAFLFAAAVARGQVDEITDVIYEINNPPTVSSSHTILSTSHSDAIVATPVLGDLLYFNGTGWARLGVGTDTQILTLASGAPSWADASSGGAPTGATYITETSNGTLSAEFAMGSLGSGLVLNATTTGIPSIFAGTVCTNQFIRSLSASGAATCASIANGDITAATIDLTTKVTGLLPYANLANGSAISVLGRSANSSGVNAPIQCTAGSDAVVRESGSALGCGTIATAGIASSAVTLAKIANAAASSRLLGSGSSGSGAAYTELTATAPLTIGASALSIAADTTNDGGTIVKQSSAPGTVQSSANWNIDGLGTVTKANILLVKTDGLFLSNTTASDATNTVQLAPSLKMCGSAWNSSGAANNLDCWRFSATPVTVAGTTTSKIDFESSINSGSFSSRATLTSGGSLSATNITASTNLTSTAGTISASAGDIVIGTDTNRLTFGSGGNKGGLAVDTSTDGLFRLENAAGVASAAQLSVGTLRTQSTNLAREISSWLQEPTGTLNGVTNYTSTIQLPAGSIIEAITYRITTAISGGGVSSFTIGDTAGNVGRFCGTQSTLTVNTTGVCLAHRNPTVTDAMGPVQTTADTVKITFNAAPTAGAIRFVIHYRQFTAPTS